MCSGLNDELLFLGLKKKKNTSSALSIAFLRNSMGRKNQLRSLKKNALEDGVFRGHPNTYIPWVPVSLLWQEDQSGTAASQGMDPCGA